jgi:hypothetical protein
MQEDPETSSPLGQVGYWVFIVFFCIAEGWRCLSGLLGRRSVSLANYHLLGTPAVCPSLLFFLSVLGFELRVFQFLDRSQA